MDDLVRQDIDNEARSGTLAPSRARHGGYRLGGNARNGKLAALARSARTMLKQSQKGAYRHRDSREEGDETDDEDVGDFSVVYNNSTAGAESKIDQSNETAILFHLASKCRRFVPRIELDQISRALGGAGHPEWTATNATANARLVCMRYTACADAEETWNRFGSTNARRSRQVFHLGQGLEVRAVSRQEVTRHERGFRVEAARHPSLVEAPRHARSGTERGAVSSKSRGHTADRDTAEVAGIAPKDALDFPALLDDLGEQIVPVQDAFMRYQTLGALCGSDRIALAVHEGMHIALAQVESILRDNIALEGVATAVEAGEPCVTLAGFCQLCVAASRYDRAQALPRSAGPQTSSSLYFDEEEARTIFTQFKLFPGDKFIEVFDVAPALRSLGLPADDDEIASTLEAQNIVRVRLPFFLSMAREAASRP